MKVFQLFKKKKFLASPWGRLGISDADVRAYLNKNDAVEHNVPLQISQALLDREANKLVAASGADALDLARAQGVLQGIAMVALELAKTNKAAAAKFKVAGNMLEGNGE